MPQAVTIQHEPTLPLSAKKGAVTKEAGDVEAFSVQLDKQVKQSQPEKKTEQADTVEAAKPADADKELAADGNNLPTEETAEKAQPDPAESDSTIATDDESDDAEIILADEPEVEAAAVVTSNAVATSTATTNSEADTDTKPNASEKPIRAQVTVSQQAVDHAKAAPVEMTAKTHPQQTTVPNSPETETVEKVVNDTEKTLSKLLKTDTTQPSVSNKVATESVTSEKTATPNLAAVLKDTDKEEGKAPKIRADILEALQRQQSKQDVGMSLRNVMASQMTAKADASTATVPSTLTAPVLTETTSPLTPLTSGSLLTSTSQSSAQGTSLSPTVLSLPIQPGMQNTAWGQVMSSRVVWMAKEGVQEAQLRMNPANLGPVEVKLHVQNDQASVTFLAQHSATRDALEQALPRLRESFAENGMELTNAHVGEQEQHQQQEQSEQANESPIFAQASRQDDDIETEAVETVSSVQETAGLSLYA